MYLYRYTSSTTRIFLPFCTALSDRLGKKWSTNLHSVRVIPFTDQPGPIHQLKDDATPIEFFHLLWEPSFFQLLADQTNLYARQKQTTRPDRRWHPTSPEEMMAFVGVNIIMGIDHKPEISNYWSTDEYLGNEGVKKVFPRERFEALTRYLHLNDSEAIPGRDQPAYDPLYKVRPLIRLSSLIRAVTRGNKRRRSTCTSLKFTTLRFVLWVEQLLYFKQKATCNRLSLLDFLVHVVFLDIPNCLHVTGNLPLARGSDMRTRAGGIGLRRRFKVG